MQKFVVKFPPRALSSLDALPTKIVPKILNSAKILETSPFPLGKPRIKKIKGFKLPLYRLRVGDYRILYRIKEREVIILKIINRRDLEKALKKMLA